MKKAAQLLDSFLIKRNKYRFDLSPQHLLHIDMNYMFPLIAACAAANRAMGTRKGEQLT